MHLPLILAFTAGLIIGASLGLLIAALCRTTSHPPTPPPNTRKNASHG